LNNTSGLILYDTNSTLITTEFNGKHCFKFISDGTLWRFIDVVFTDFEIGSQVQFTSDILSENNCVLNIYHYGDTSGNIMTSIVEIPASQNWGTYTITSTEIPSDTTSVRIRLLQSTTIVNTKTYITNCNLKII